MYTAVRNSFRWSWITIHGGRPRVWLLVLVLISACVLSSCTAVTTAEVDADLEKNNAALKAAQQNIEQYRKGPAKLSVVNASGRPVPNVHVRVQQISHDFKFGCYLKIDDLDPSELPEYTRRFKQLFNYAVIGVYWRHMEKKQGAPDWSWFDREAALAEKLGMRVAAAPVLWGTNQYGRPEWLPVRKNELMPALEQRVQGAVTHSGTIDDWEIVNEPLSRKTDPFAVAATDEYIEQAFKWARQADPKKHLVINESGVFGSDPERNYNRDRYFDLVRGLIEKQVPFDAIGLQAHSKGEWYEPADVAEQLDKYASLGRPIQITEFSAQTRNAGAHESPMRIKGSYRTGQWDGDRQAEFYREFYTVAFGNPQVEAIVTWGLDDSRAWLPGIGLIAKDGEAKPAFLALDRLINHDWTTTVETTTDESGQIDLRGYYGDYAITADVLGRGPVNFNFKLVKDRENEWVVRVDP